MTELRHPIRVVAQRTGLTSHVIRVWEKRYQAVTPSRTNSNRRLYTDTEIERLNLLRQATTNGHSIGNIAQLSHQQLQKLVAHTTAVEEKVATGHRTVSANHEHTVNDCLEAVTRLDSAAFERLLEAGALSHGQHGLLHHVIAPLTRRIGELWLQGKITAAHEHMATWVIRLFLGRSAKPYAASDTAPRLVVATPAGQLHEIGAVMVSAAASNVGWKVTYLGGSLPAPEIAGVAIQNAAKAVALSLVYPEDDPNLPAELQNLRRYLPPSAAIIVGGRAAPAYQQALNSIGAILCRDLEDLYGHLDKLRLPRI